MRCRGWANPARSPRSPCCWRAATAPSSPAPTSWSTAGCACSRVTTINPMDHETKTAAPGALGGVRVLDFTQLLQGPYATQMLGDLGADIIKVEKAGSGDLYRSMTFFNSWIAGKESPCFLAWNRNKRSLALDLKQARGRKIIERFVRRCDVVVENFRPGVMARLGFGYADCVKLNPRLI